MMFCLNAVARPQSNNVEHGVVSESHIAAWITAETEAEAFAIATRDIAKSKWDLIEFDGICSCDDNTYDADNECREYYELAKTDPTVYVYHNCPMYPVYYFELRIKQLESVGELEADDPGRGHLGEDSTDLAGLEKIETVSLGEESLIDETPPANQACKSHRGDDDTTNFGDGRDNDTNDSETTEARAWILNETVCEEHDVFESDFWSGERLERALAIVTHTIVGNGYSVVGVSKQCPVSPIELGSDEKYYDAAEEDGLCVMVVHDLDSGESS